MPNNGLEAAIKSTTSGKIIQGKNNTKVEGTVRSYSLINGDKKTLWVKNNLSKEFVKAKRIEKSSLKPGNTSPSLLRANCTNYTTVEYTVVCETESDNSTYCWEFQDYTDYTICENNEEEYDDGDWGGGGGSGGDAPAPDPEENCEATSNTFLVEWINNSYSTNEIQDISLIDFDSETRTKKYTWTILKSIGWYLFSWEIGVHERTTNSNPQLQWKWKSLTHSGISRVGVVLGGNVDYSLLTAIPTLGQYNAIMDLDFKVKYSLVCKGSPVSVELVYNSSKNFNIND